MTDSRINARPALVGEHMVPLTISEGFEAEAKAWRMVAQDLVRGYSKCDNIQFQSGLADYESLVEYYDKP